MDIFYKFVELPPELQIIVWEFAFHHEAYHRLVLLRARRVVPMKYLCSPFLSVSYWCRHYALKFYNVKLAVERVQGWPATSAWTRDDYKKIRSLPRGMGEQVVCITRDIVWTKDKYYGREPGDLGCVYVSSKFDTFMFDWSLFEQSANGARIDGLKLVSELVPHSVCADLRILVRATRSIFSESIVYSQEEAQASWKTDTFSGAYALRSFCIGIDNTLLRVIPWLVKYLWRTGDFAITDEARKWKWQDRVVTIPIDEEWQPGDSLPGETIHELHPQVLDRVSKFGTIIKILAERLEPQDMRFRMLINDARIGRRLLRLVAYALGRRLYFLPTASGSQ
ncbi:hypothetical protein F5Y13DRAFT_198561 [Hypoxylon sp. FL1857]|nr:hypothetical protein F5Y13DRAFT_198561 [Hypoxylon sp. FL1857]